MHPSGLEGETANNSRRPGQSYSLFSLQSTLKFGLNFLALQNRGNAGLASLGSFWLPSPWTGRSENRLAVSATCAAISLP
jgi:hypothetical protein